MKRRHKFVCSILMLFLFCGCTANYDLDVTKENIVENLSIINYNNATWDVSSSLLGGKTPKEYLDTELEFPTSVLYNQQSNFYEKKKLKGVNYYNKNKIFDSKKLGINYNYKFSILNYKNSYLFNSCIDKFSIKANSASFELKTFGNIKCFDYYQMLDTLNINIKIPNNATDIVSNADVKKDDIYTWNLDQNNYKDKMINISFKYDSKNQKNKKNNDNSVIYMGIATIGIISLGLIVFIITKIINNKNNKL